MSFSQSQMLVLRYHVIGICWGMHLTIFFIFACHQFAQGYRGLTMGHMFGHIFGMFGMSKATWGCQYVQSPGCGSDLAARVRKCSCVATNCRQEAQKRPRKGPGARQQNHFWIQTFWCRMFCSELWCYAVFRHLMTYLMSPNTSQHLPLRSVPKNWYSKTFSLLIWPIFGDFFPITDVNWLSHGQPSCDSTSKATQETELAVRLSEHSVEPGKTGRLIEDGSCTSLRKSHIFPHIPTQPDPWKSKKFPENLC